MILNGINEVSRETGIHPSSLRRWESLGFIAPGRISFGETWVRVYSDQDVELLKRAKRLMDEGYNLRAAFERVGERELKKVSGSKVMACFVHHGLLISTGIEIM